MTHNAPHLPPYFHANLAHPVPDKPTGADTNDGSHRPDDIGNDVAIFGRGGFARKNYSDWKKGQFSKKLLGKRLTHTIYVHQLSTSVNDQILNWITHSDPDTTHLLRQTQNQCNAELPEWKAADGVNDLFF